MQGDPEIGRKAQKLTAQIARILYGEEGIKLRNWAPADAESIRYCIEGAGLAGPRFHLAVAQIAGAPRRTATSSPGGGKALLAETDAENRCR